MSGLNHLLKNFTFSTIIIILLSFLHSHNFEFNWYRDKSNFLPQPQQIKTNIKIRVHYQKKIILLIKFRITLEQIRNINLEQI